MWVSWVCEVVIQLIRLNVCHWGGQGFMREVSQVAPQTPMTELGKKKRRKKQVKRISVGIACHILYRSNHQTVS